MHDDIPLRRHRRAARTRNPVGLLVALVLTLILGAVASLYARPGYGAAPIAPTCTLALALGIDVSNSIRGADREHVARGTVEALLSEDVLNAVESGSVWLSVFKFGMSTQDVAPWQRVSSREEMARFVAGLGDITSPFSGSSGTSLATALRHARALFDAAPPCGEYVLDLQTDGNLGGGYSELTAIRSAMEQFERFVHTVNILYVGADLSMTEFARQHLLFGPKAFLAHAPTYADYPLAMRKKLVLEIGSCAAVCEMPIEDTL